MGIGEYILGELQGEGKFPGPPLEMWRVIISSISLNHHS